jgi:hypothetical protein
VYRGNLKVSENSNPKVREKPNLDIRNISQQNPNQSSNPRICKRGYPKGGQYRKPQNQIPISVEVRLGKIHKNKI